MMFLTPTWRKPRAKLILWSGTDPYAFSKSSRTTWRSFLAYWIWSQITVAEELENMPSDSLCWCYCFVAGRWSFLLLWLQRRSCLQHSAERCSGTEQWQTRDPRGRCLSGSDICLLMWSFRSSLTMTKESLFFSSSRKGSFRKLEHWLSFLFLLFLMC